MIGTRAVLTAAGAALFLSACAGPRFHDQAELNSVGKQCGLALGEVFQDESEKRLLFVLAPTATPEQRSCIIDWAKKHRLKPVIVDRIEFKESFGVLKTRARMVL